VAVANNFADFLAVVANFAGEQSAISVDILAG
jgi:hypothetical protein